MKKLFLIKNSILGLLSIGLFIFSAVPAFFAISYFLMKDPNINWVKMLENIPDDRKWFIASLILITSLISAVLPLSLFLVNLKNSKQKYE